MEFETQKEYIQKKMYAKGINIETQDYVIKYIYMNQKLFGDILNVDKVIERILNNLNDNIIILDTKSNPLQEIARISTSSGCWAQYDKKVMINPINKISSIISKREREKNDSTVMHEIDHCATTTYINISERQKEEYTQKYLERNKIKNYIIENIIRNKISRMYEKNDRKLAISGIQDCRQVVQKGIDLTKLNEGITAYKQEMYDKFLETKPHTAYVIEKKVAKFIGDVIGKEELIKMHFDNDYEKIRDTFKEKTGRDLNELVEKLNKKSNIKAMLFGDAYIRMISIKMEEYMKDISAECKKDKRTEFIPKYEMSERNMKERKSEQYPINTKIKER